MKVFKQFLVADRGALNDSYVSAASDGHACGLSLHDGSGTVSFNFNLDNEVDKRAAMQTLAGIELAIRFLRKEGEFSSRKWRDAILAKLGKALTSITSRPSP